MARWSKRDIYIYIPRLYEYLVEKRLRNFLSFYIHWKFLVGLRLAAIMHACLQINLNFFIGEVGCTRCEKWPRDCFFRNAIMLPQCSAGADLLSCIFSIKFHARKKNIVNTCVDMGKQPRNENNSFSFR